MSRSIGDTGSVRRFRVEDCRDRGHGTGRSVTGGRPRGRVAGNSLGWRSFGGFIAPVSHTTARSAVPTFLPPAHESTVPALDGPEREDTDRAGRRRTAGIALSSGSGGRYEY